MSFVNLFRDALWPGGKLKPPGVPRSAEEKIRTRDEANRKLSSLVPGVQIMLDGHTTMLINKLSRFGRKHDWEIQRQTRSKANICRASKPPPQSAYSLRDH